MKLYTEEQLKKAFHRGEINEGCTALQIHVDDFIDSLAPIELPSDEEIKKKWSNSKHVMHEMYIDGLIDGAKWMREQIKNK